MDIRVKILCLTLTLDNVNCNFVYYGQTDRALETRLKEHKRAVRVGDNNSKVAQHANQFVHNIDFDHATIVDRAGNFQERLFLEAWYSQRDSNAGNEHIDIPDVYRAAVVSYVFAGVARAEL